MASPLPRVVVLCGGFGSRLGELTRNIPKPMIEIAGRPYLERVVESFATRGLREFVFLTGYRHEVIEDHFGSGADLDVTIRYSRESEPLGTGGAVRDARPLLGPRFLLTYGDVLRRFDYDRFVTEHEGNCVAVYPRISSGNIDTDGRIVLTYDKNRAGLPFVDAGFAVMKAEVIDMLPEAGACSFESAIYPELARGRALDCEIVDHDFLDIGTPDELERARAALEAQ